MENKYKLVGFLNMFSVIPDFVYPVFECDEDKKLYFQREEDKDLSKSLGFVLIKEDALDKVVFLENMNHNQKNTQVISSIHSELIFGFHVSENEVVFGNYEYFKNFFETFQTDKKFLINEIFEFLAIYDKK